MFEKIFRNNKIEKKDSQFQKEDAEYRMVKQDFAKQNPAETKTEKIAIIEQKEIDKNIQEHPQEFIKWFKDFKNSMLDWPESFFKDKKIKSSIIGSAILYSVLQAGNISALENEEIKINNLNQVPEYEQIYETNNKLAFQPEELVMIKADQQENLALKINAELEAFKGLDEVLNKAVSKKLNLFPEDIIRKFSAGEKIFDISGRMKLKIDEANDNYSNLLSTEPELRFEKERSNVKKILENGQLNFKELIKTIPEIVFSLHTALLVHEIGHRDEAMKQGADSASIKMGIFSGLSLYQGTIDNYAAFNAAGININNDFSEFIVSNLRDEDAPGQFLAIMALASESFGMHYSLQSNTKYNRGSSDDIINYSEESGTSLTELALGLTADFIFDRDNWKLLEIALGKEGVKIPKATLAPFYKLGDHGPIMGIEYKGVF